MSFPDSGAPARTREADVTQLLEALGQGDREALDRLMPLLYEQLRRLAHARLRSERPDHTLNTTGLVHEAFLRLVEIHEVPYQSRAHFLATIARLMRRVLVDYARMRGTQKRGGGDALLRLDDIDVPIEEKAGTLLALDEALDRLSAVDSRLGQIVECRFFGGLTEAETAEVLQMSERTVRRDWTKAKAWLYCELTA